MLIRNIYLDQCLTGQKAFNTTDFNASLKCKRNHMRKYTFADPVLIRECLLCLIKDTFPEEVKSLKKKTEINIFKLGVLKGIDIHSMVLYIFSAISSIQKESTCRILGQTHKGNNPFFDIDSLNIEDMNEINKTLVELKIIE